jgi:hypothetical protein
MKLEGLQNSFDTLTDKIMSQWMSGERIREGDQALPSSITVGTGQTGTVQQ